jgi:hypothetical protein
VVKAGPMMPEPLELLLWGRRVDDVKGPRAIAVVKAGSMIPVPLELLL